MEREKELIGNEKQAYEKPVLQKHGRLKDVTAIDRFGSIKNGSVLGCTRL